jgi:hypothetical protein
MTPPPRSRQQRKQDTLSRLEHDEDLWVATADSTGTPYLVPLSFLWDGTDLVISTPTKSPTAVNLLTSGRTRLALGPTRDVTIIEATARPLSEVPAPLGDAFATKTGFDPRTLSTPYTYFRLRPQLLQAWREANELSGRTLMRSATWLDA